MSDGGGANLLADAVQYLLTGGAGILGRTMYHMHLVQQGKRKSWLWVACDLLIALCLGWIVLGICDWLGVGFKMTQSLAIVAGWGGPHLMDRLISRAIDKWLGSSDE